MATAPQRAPDDDHTGDDTKGEPACHAPPQHVPPRRRLAALARYAALGLACAVTSLIPAALHLPSPTLFAGLLVGIAHGLTARQPTLIPDRLATGAQGVVGVVQGAYVTLPAILSIGTHAPVVILACLVTLAVTVVTGRLLARTAHLDLPTAAFGMIAGGAQGIISISDELGADSRMVAVMQYLRVVLIVLTTPLVAALAFHAHAGSGAVVAARATGWPAGTLFVTVSIAAGLLLARVTRLPSGALLGPMIVAATLVLAGVPFATAVPPAIEYVAYAVIGLEVGVRFTPQAIRQAGRVFLACLGFTVGLLAVCAGLGLLLARLSGASPLADYLATTPGGLYSVLAVAANTGSDTTFVLSVQVIRLFMMLLAAPPLARWLTAADRRRDRG
jgi:uncharacterized protein